MQELYLVGNWESGCAVLQCVREPLKGTMDLDYENAPLDPPEVEEIDELPQKIELAPAQLGIAGAPGRQIPLTSSEMINELIARQYDWRFYKQIYDNHLRQLMEAHKEAKK
jgi:hypothetical protein